MAQQGDGRRAVVAGLRARHDRLERLVGRLRAAGDGAGGDEAAEPLPGAGLALWPAARADGFSRAGGEASVDSRP